MGALDSINLSSTPTESVDQSSTSSAAPTGALAYAKAAPAKGPYALPTAIGATGVDPALLENMQKLIDEKEKQKGSFLEGLRDATAWWSGGVAGPAEALQNRAAEKDRQEAELFGMKSNLAQAKISQQLALGQQQTNEQQIAGMFGGGTGGVGNASPQIAKWLSDLNRVNPAQAAVEIAKLNQQSFKDQSGFLNNPASWNTSVEYKVQDANGKWSIDKMTPIEAQRRGIPDNQRVGYQAPNASAAAASPTSAGPGGANAVAAGLPVISGMRTPEQGQYLYNQSQQPGYAGPPVAKPGTSAHETGNALDIDMKRATPEHVKWLKDNGYTQPLPGTDPNHWQKAGVQAAPATNVAPPPPPHPSTFAAPTAAPSTSDIAQQQAISQAGGTAQAQESGKLFANAENTVRTQGMSSGSRQVVQDSTMKLLDDPELKAMVGKFQTGSKADAFVRQMQAGIEAGNFGSIGLKELQENLAKSGASQEAIRKFEQLGANLKQNELEWSTNYLKGQGAVSDNERRLVQQAVGSVNDPIGKLKTLTATMRERALFDAEVYGQYKQFKKQYGANANFGEFLDSDQYQALNDKHNQRLATVLNMDPAQLKSNDGFKMGSVAVSAAPNAYEDAAKEARYQKYKASQGK